MRTVTLKPGRAKALWLGHPWVHADSVAEATGGAEADDWVAVHDADGRSLGAGFLSPASALRVRLLVRGAEPASPDAVLADRLERAVALRRRLFPDPARTDAYRLVHAEGDGLPGLVVDRFRDQLVAQFAIAATHARRTALAERLLALTGARGLVARPAGFEAQEAIPEDSLPFALGEAPAEHVEIREEGLVFRVSPQRGQKTGHYVDQRENRLLVGRMASDLDVLDLYAGTGGFGLQALRHGARSVLAVEASARSAQAAVHNAERNGLAQGLDVLTADASEVLAALRAERRQFGLVIADPPNFFPRRGGDRGALKAHRELSVRALSRVRPGGFLATFSCSARFDPQGFLEMLRSASRECRREFRILRELAAGPDHPVAAGLPEGRYLTGLLVQVEAEADRRPDPGRSG